MKLVVFVLYSATSNFPCYIDSKLSLFSFTDARYRRKEEPDVTWTYQNEVLETQKASLINCPAVILKASSKAFPQAEPNIMCCVLGSEGVRITRGVEKEQGQRSLVPILWSRVCTVSILDFIELAFVQSCSFNLNYLHHVQAYRSFLCKLTVHSNSLLTFTQTQDYHHHPNSEKPQSN